MSGKALSSYFAAMDSAYSILVWNESQLSAVNNERSVRPLANAIIRGRFLFPDSHDLFEHSYSACNHLLILADAILTIKSSISVCLSGVLYSVAMPLLYKLPSNATPSSYAAFQTLYVSLYCFCPGCSSA